MTGTLGIRHALKKIPFTDYLTKGANFVFVQIAELEAQCNDANQEKQKNVQLAVRVKELEAEVQEKEQVSLQLVCLKTGSTL